jgi:hypothetical protein
MLVLSTEDRNILPNEDRHIHPTEDKLVVPIEDKGLSCLPRTLMASVWITDMMPGDQQVSHWYRIGTHS